MELHSTLLYISFAILLLSMVITFIRLSAGPTVNDRVTAMDLIASITMALILIYSVLVKNRHYFDIAIIISLVSFMGTVAISTYLKLKK